MEGKEYGIQCRVRGQDTGDRVADWTPPAVEVGVDIPGEEVLLDGNVEAEGKPFFAVGGAAVTIDGNLYAYAVDNAGDERFTLRIKDLRTGELLPDVIENVFYGISFSPDGSRIFYTVVDDSWRPYQVKSHVLGTPVGEDEVIYQEDDVAMWLGFELSADRRHLVLSIGCSEFSETRLLRFDDARRRTPHRDLPRRAHPLRGRAVPAGGRLGTRAESDPADPQQGRHQFHGLAGGPGRARQAARRAALDHRRRALRPGPRQRRRRHLDPRWWSPSARTPSSGSRSCRWPGWARRSRAPPVEPAFDEELYTAGVAGSDYEAPVIRMGYTSYFTPSRVYDFVLPTAEQPAGELLLRKESPVLGGYSAVGLRRHPRMGGGRPTGPGSRSRCCATPPCRQDSTAAGLVYGYGSYEMSMDPGFGIPRLSLLDRGIVFVIAHIRGGGELGRHWYDDGKKLHKKNTFTDFIAATDWLAQSGWVDPARIAAMGGSAGGLLMGAVANLAPEKYAAIVAAVPFVDALTTILDPELPLSALEWEEWGNPITDPRRVRVHEVVHAVRERPRRGVPEDRGGHLLQ